MLKWRVQRNIFEVALEENVYSIREKVCNLKAINSTVLRHRVDSGHSIDQVTIMTGPPRIKTRSKRKPILMGAECMRITLLKPELRIQRNHLLTLLSEKLTR